MVPVHPAERAAPIAPASSAAGGVRVPAPQAGRSDDRSGVRRTDRRGQRVQPADQHRLALNLRAAERRALLGVPAHPPLRRVDVDEGQLAGTRQQLRPPGQRGQQQPARRCVECFACDLPGALRSSQLAVPCLEDWAFQRLATRRPANPPCAMDMIAVPSVALAIPTGHTVTLDHPLHTCRDTLHLNASAAVNACRGSSQSAVPVVGLASQDLDG